MSIFSIEFGLLFLIFWLIYFILNFNQTLQKLLILAFSYLFLYLSNIDYLFINIIFTITIYTLSLLIFKLQSKSIFITSVSFVIGFLVIFKQLGFLNFYLEEFGFKFLENNILPIGISFYSFMSIYYLRAIFYRQIEPKFLDLFVFLSFFAVIVSGPILKPQKFLKSLNKKKIFCKSSEIYTLLCLAIFKKLIIANYLFELVIPIFNAPNEPAYLLVAACFGYTVMLYADFSGYVDFVLALGLMCGFKLPKNFNRPFLAANLSEFWRRWHISLMKFFKEMVYVPLGGNRYGAIRNCTAILIVFLISGFWHASTISFAFWGLLHGLAVVFLRLTNRLRLSYPISIKRYFTLVFVSFAWVFFVLDFDSGVEYFKLILSGLQEWYLEILLTFFVAFLGLTFYNLFDFYAIILLFFKALNFILSVIFLVFFGLIIYIFMPQAMPNFIYQGF